MKSRGGGGGSCRSGGRLAALVGVLVSAAVALLLWQATALSRRDRAAASSAAAAPPAAIAGTSSEVDAALARLDAALSAVAASAPAPASALRGDGDAGAAPAAAGGGGVAALAAVRELSEGVAALRRELPLLLAAELAARSGGVVPAVAPAVAPAPAPAPAPPAAAAAAASPPGRRVVLGLAKGVDAPLLYRFVRSLRAVTSAATTDVVLFLHGEDAPAASPLAWALAAYGVDVQRFDPSAFAEARHRGYHPSSYRWLLMREWLRSPAAAARGYEAVLFADVRDVVFAADPFAPMASAGAGAAGQALAPAFYAFLEARPRTIAECGWNAGWVRDCFGEAGLREVGGSVISCSGTSLATWAAAQVYAALLADELSTNACERNGADQGVHNYVVFGGRLRAALAAAGAGELTVVSNEEGWVGTVQSMNTLTRDRAGRLLNERGVPYAIVHQYDRSKVLLDQLEREYTWMDAGTVQK